VLLGALTTALLALVALPAVSRRAFRLAQERARLSAPLSAAEAQADRDALRGRHAIEIALADRRADSAQDKWSAAQIALGERAAEIVRRDSEIEDKAQEISRQREELTRLADELTARDTEISARETALRDFEGQRDAAEVRRAQATADLKQAQAEAAGIRARLEERIEDLSRELSLTQHRADSALFAAKAKIADLERRLEESETDALRLRRQVLDLSELQAAEAKSVVGPPFPELGVVASQLPDAVARENELSLRLSALTAALAEAEAAARAARADRDEAEREADFLRERTASSEAQAQRLTQADDNLRSAIARLGRELVAQHAAQALVDSQREPAS
jgi:chromosome segregation ATPase